MGKGSKVFHLAREALNLYLNSLIYIMHRPLSSSSVWPYCRTDKSSCGCSRYEGTALALHSLSVTYYTAASKQWLSQQSHSQLAWLMQPSRSPGRKDHHIILQGFSKGSFAPSFLFNCRTSKMTVVLSVKQEARPAELRGSGGQTRRFTELVDCGRQRLVTICDFTSTPTMSSNNDRPTNISRISDVPEMPTECSRGSLCQFTEIWILSELLK